MKNENMTALQVVENSDHISKLGQVFAQSGFFGAVTASMATAALVNCALEGLSPMQYRAKYHTMEDGTTAVKSDFIQREFHRLGGSWKFNEWTAEVCDMTFTYKGETLPFRVTLDEFKANGVAMGKNGIKKNWKSFPREMLKARCMATAIRAICPEALGGLYTQEEAADFAVADAQPKTAANVTVSASPIAEPTPTVEAGVCPCGSVKGKSWADIPSETLEKILATPAEKAKGMTAEHRNAIVAELGRREEAQDEAIEPEVVD